MKEGGPNNYIEPAPHPSQGGTGEWRKVIAQKGPIGLMIQLQLSPKFNFKFVLGTGIEFGSN